MGGGKLSAGGLIMENKITAWNPASALNHNHRKKGQSFYSYSLIDLNEGEESAVLRLYDSASGARNYACLWVWGDTDTATGSGYAGGYGYHRPSEAAQNAFDAAGIALESPIGGGGDSAIEGAMKALAAHLGIERFMLLRAHA